MKCKDSFHKFLFNKTYYNTVDEKEIQIFFWKSFGGDWHYDFSGTPSQNKTKQKSLPLRVQS